EPPLLECPCDPLHSLEILRVPQADAEAISLQVAGAELVGMAGRFQHAEALAGQAEGRLGGDAGKAHPLRGDRVAILLSGDPHLPRRDAEGAGQGAGDEEGVLAPLLHPDEEVIPFARRRVEGNFVDAEVLGDSLDPPGHPREIGGDERQVHARLPAQRSKAVRALSALSNMRIASAERLTARLTTFAQSAPLASPRGAESWVAVFAPWPTKAERAFS